MTKFLFCMLLTFFLSVRTDAQTTFMNRYGSDFYDIGHKVIQTLDGNYLIVGYTIGFGSGGNAMLIKIDTNGVILWVKDYAGINGDIIRDVEELPDSSLVMVGSTGSYGAGSFDGFIMKTDSYGEYVWAKSFGDIGYEEFNQIEKDGSGGFYVLCGGYDFSTYNAIVIRMDATGSVQWARTNTNWTSTNGGSSGLTIKAISSAGVVLANTTGGPTAIDVIKFSIAGTQLWTNTYTPSPGGGGLNGLSMTELASGELVINYGFANVNTVAQSMDNAILKLSASGNYVWNKSFGGTYEDYPNSILVSNDDNIILGAYSNSAGNGELDANIMKIDTSGTIIWSKNYGLVWSEYITDIIQGVNDEFVLTGQQWSVGYDYDSSKVFLLKTDLAGISSCNDVSWNPIVSLQSINMTAGPTAQIYTLPESETIVWSANLRYIYTLDNCSPVNINEFSLESFDWIIYPNPICTHATIELNEKYERGIIKVIDLFGREIEIIPFVGNKIEFERNELKAGIYFIQIISEHSIVACEKIIIQ